MPSVVVTAQEPGCLTCDESAGRTALFASSTLQICVEPCKRDEKQCCSVIGLTTSYCSPATDNPSDPGQRKEGHCLVCGVRLVSSLSSDNLLTRQEQHEVRQKSNTTTRSR
ncbi:hypothetical protein JOB18_004912 [Solea senegalensis]|uniref:Uncharacterized protein n=1 Tax=Solea senegalensis TaxID=28829 RepID=A0AAV6SPA5_SOLSE|nr:hypothetical protein JOB18_004912 [Solea senegalensis]